jgi:protein-tyrosine phosphatase
VIDIHCHLLPGLDDGSRSLAQSVAVLRRMAADGVTDLVLTPHLNASEINAGPDSAIAARDAALERLRPLCPLGLALHPGFEILLDQPLTPLALGDRRLSLAGSRYYLVESPVMMVGEFLSTALEQIARAGLVPVLAHPERYQACSPQAVRVWREAGARMQVDARTLTRATGRGHQARLLVAGGLADVIAADNHGDSRSLLSAVDFLKGRAGGQSVVEQVLQLLTHLNPLAITHDWDLAPVPAMVVPERWMERVRRFLDDER